MRNSLIKQLTTMALGNPNIHAILSDIGVFAFKQVGFPEKQMTNCGICEQAGIDICAGLALTGKIPFFYTIASFATARCYEQIKMACYNKLPIKIVGVGAGLTYSHEGPTHHACEDIAIMRVLPDMHVYSPCSSEETALITQEMVNNCKPSYIRLTTKPEGPYDWSLQCKYVEKKVEGYGTTVIVPVVTKQTEYMPFQCAQYSINAKVAIITTGGIIGNVLQAVKDDGRFSVYNLSQLWPVETIDKGPDLFSVLSKHEKVVIIEEHYGYGGLGTIINEVINFFDFKTDFYSIGIPNHFCPVTGTREEVLDWAGLTVGHLKERLICIAGL